MKKLLITVTAFFITVLPVMAGQVIEECNGCRIIYQKKVVRTTVVKPVIAAPVPGVPVYAGQPIYASPFPYVTGPNPVPVAAPVVPVAPVAPTYSYVPTPEASNIYSPPGYPTNVPVAASPNGSCAMYVDPYDLFGQLFGGADLVQSCWTRVY